MADGARADGRLLAVAWGVTVAAVALLAWRLPALPDLVPVARGPAGERLAEKSALIVLRVPLIGAAGLVAAHTLLRAASTPGWRGFWRAAVVCLGAKTAAEAVDLALLGTPFTAARNVAFAGTLAAVLAFVGIGAVAWSRGRLAFTAEAAPRWGDLPPGARAALGGAGAAWLALATAPVWGG